MFWKINLNPRFTIVRHIVLLGPLVFFSSTMAIAQVDSRYLESRSARVIVEGVDASGKAYAKASSGFLWKSKDQIVTSLHGVPPGGKIRVTCLGVTRKAKVQNVLKDADLILLKTEKLLDPCQYFSGLNLEKPKEGTKLWTFGWHGGARGGSSRGFVKGGSGSSPETLDYLVGGAPLKNLQKYNIPSTTLDIYYVQGGLLPGYSGGPAVDANKQLVGIVDGGLNKGTSNYNWLIPAKNLDGLGKSLVKTIPSEVAAMSDLLFSANISGEEKPRFALFASGSADENDSDVIQYKEDEVNFEWVKTKTQTLYELGETADDAQGVDQLLVRFAAAAGISDREQLSFDVYEEPEFGLIITVPEGQGLEYRQGSGLVSEHDDLQTGLLRFNHDPPILDAHGDSVSPSGADYFQDAVSQILIDCYDPGVSYCDLDESTLRIIDFGDADKILKFGMISYNAVTNNPEFYNYHSIAVSGNTAFEAKTFIFPVGATGLFQCLESDANNADCANTVPAQKQLAQLIAVHLTSFAALGSYASQRIVQRQFIYDTSKDFLDTLRIPFLKQGKVLFYNTRGTEWNIYFNDDTEGIIYEYQARSDGYVYLQYKEQFFSIPVAGGQYYAAEDGEDWVLQGTLER